MSVVKATLIVAFEVTPAFRKRVAAVMDLRTSDLPVDDVEFVQMVLHHMTMDFSMQDEMTGDILNLTQFFAQEPTQLPEEMPLEEVDNP